jgi:hypothetical protein
MPKAEESNCNTRGQTRFITLLRTEGLGAWTPFH